MRVRPINAGVVPGDDNAVGAGARGRHSSVATAFVFIAFAVALLTMLAFLVYFDRAHFDSDNAAASMLAEAMRSRGSLLPSGWTYNNGDLMLPSGAIVIAMLIGILPNGFLAHAIFAVCALLMLLGAVWGLVLRLHWHRIVGVFVCVIFAAGISRLFTDMVYAQSTYVWWPAGFFLGAAILLRHHSADQARRAVWPIVAMFALIASISFANPGRVALMMVVPLYAFDLCLCHDRVGTASATTHRLKNLLVRFGLFDAMTLIGIGAAFLAAAAAYDYLQAIGSIPSALGAAGLHWSGWSSVARHWHIFIEGLPIYLGVVPRPMAQWLPFDWFSAAVGWLFLIALVVVAFDAGRRLRRSEQPVRRALCWAFIVAFVPVFAMYLAFDQLAVDSTTLRYFTVPICILVILLGCALDDIVSARPRVAPIGIALFAIAIAVAGIVRLDPFVTRAAGGFPVAMKSAKQRLGEVLQRENLQWGYATWWNAGATTVLSDSRIRVSPIDINANGIAPFYTMTLRDWYQPSSWQRPTFLVLSRKELTPRMLRPVEGTLGKPQRTIDTSDYRVLVYDYNIARRFACMSADRLDVPFTGDDRHVRITAAGWNEAFEDTTALVVHVRNDGARTVASAGRYPLMIGVQLLDADGRVIAPDFVHAPLPCPIAAGSEATINVWLPDRPSDATTVRVDLVQERVAWFQTWGEETWDLPLAPDASASVTKQ